MADPKRFDADPDPTFQANADPDPAPDPDPKLLELGRVKCFSSKKKFFLLHILTKLVMSNFLSNNAGGRPRGEG